MLVRSGCGAERERSSSAYWATSNDRSGKDFEIRCSLKLGDGIGIASYRARGSINFVLLPVRFAVAVSWDGLGCWRSC